MLARIRVCVVFSALVAFAGTMVWKYRAQLALQAELDHEIATARTLVPVRTEHARLSQAHAAATDHAQAGAIAAELPQARAEVAALRKHLEEMSRNSAGKGGDLETKFAIGHAVPAADWRHAGNATPQAALETALWAGAGGDVDTFSSLLMIAEGGPRRAAEALWRSAPPAMRASYSSPERLLAFVSVRDVPLGSVEVRHYNPLENRREPAAQLQLMLRDAGGKPKNTSLVFVNPGDGWRLVVTESVVAKYAKMLSDSVSAADPK